MLYIKIIYLYAYIISSVYYKCYKIQVYLVILLFYNLISFSSKYIWDRQRGVQHLEVDDAKAFSLYYACHSEQSLGLEQDLHLVREQRVWLNVVAPPSFDDK